jgi:anaerobic magnesium-protoporphyrin IX monomethyl ester cyclase
VVGVDVPVLSRMRERGCDIVLYGFESITQEILDAYGKNARPHQVVEAIEATRRAGLKVGGLFIIGAPGETEQSLANLVRFCGEFKDVTRVKYLSLLPGTPEYRSALARGIIKDELAHLDFLSRERSVEDDEIINVCGLPEELLRSVYRDVNRQIQLRPYEYWNPADRYLSEPTRFELRPLPLGGPPETFTSS